MTGNIHTDRRTIARQIHRATDWELLVFLGRCHGWEDTARSRGDVRLAESLAYLYDTAYGERLRRAGV